MNTAVLSADKIAFEGVRNFSPTLIFDCGQCFRFDVLADGSAEGTVGREHAKISVQGDTVTVDGGQDRELWRRFLCIDEDYDAIKKNIPDKPRIRPRPEDRLYLRQQGIQDRIR